MGSAADRDSVDLKIIRNIPVQWIGRQIEENESQRIVEQCEVSQHACNGHPKMRERVGLGRKKITEELINENLPILIKTLTYRLQKLNKPQTWKRQGTTSRYLIVKLLKDKE